MSWYIPLPGRSSIYTDVVSVAPLFRLYTFSLYRVDLMRQKLCRNWLQFLIMEPFFLHNFPENNPTHFVYILGLRGIPPRVVMMSRI